MAEQPSKGEEDDTAAKAERKARELAERGSQDLIRALARAREELEDIWAEAQNLRRGR